MKEIKLNRGKVAKVSDADFSDVSRFKWYAVKIEGGWYARRGIDSRHLEYLHIRIMNPVAGIQIDHIDGDGLNCTRENMRYATHSQNMMNRKKHKNNTSGYKGVTWRKDNHKWRVSIKANGIVSNIGQFDDIIEASCAYNNAARLLHGEFARPNVQETEESTR